MAEKKKKKKKKKVQKEKKKKKGRHDILKLVHRMASFSYSTYVMLLEANKLVKFDIMLVNIHELSSTFLTLSTILHVGLVKCH
jgi:hypothetical protein